MDIIKKINIKESVADITTAIQNGDVDALEAFVNLKKIEEIIKQVKKNIDDLAIDEACKYSQKTFDYNDAEITIKNSPTRYNYSNIPAIVKKENELKELKDKHKTALRVDVVDTETGELLVPPIVKGGRELLSIKLKK